MKMQRKIGSTFHTMLGDVVVTRFMAKATTEDEYRRWVSAQQHVQALTAVVTNLRNYLEGNSGAPGDVLDAERHIDVIKANIFEAIAIRKVEADRKRKDAKWYRKRCPPKGWERKEQAPAKKRATRKKVA